MASLLRRASEKGWFQALVFEKSGRDSELTDRSGEGVLWGLLIAGVVTEGESAKSGKFDMKGINVTFLSSLVEVACDVYAELLARDMDKRAPDPLRVFESREFGTLSSALIKKDAGMVGP